MTLFDFIIVFERIVHVLSTRDNGTIRSVLDASMFVHFHDVIDLWFDAVVPVTYEPSCAIDRLVGETALYPIFRCNREKNLGTV